MAVRRGRRRFWRILAVACVLTASLVGSYSFGVSRVQSQINTEREALKALGALTTEQEFLAASTHQGADASPHIKDAERMVDQISPEVIEGVRDGSNDSEAMQRYLQHFATVLPHLRAAGECDVLRPDEAAWLEVRKHQRFDSYGSELHLTQSVVSRSLLRYLTILARIGRYDEAKALLPLYLKLLTLEIKKPTLSSLSTSRVRQSTRMRGVVFLAEVAGDANQARTLESFVRSSDEHMDYRYYLSGEPVNDLSYFYESLPSKQISIQAVWSRKKLPTASEIQHSTRLGQKQIELELLRAWRVVFENIPENRHDLEGHLVAIEQGRAYSVGLSEPTRTAVLELLPETDFIRRFEVDSKVRQRTIPTALRLVADRYRLGQFPSKLPDYGEISTDPLTGKPLCYVIKPAHVSVYSMGLDGIDGGMSRPFDEAGAVSIKR